MHAAARPTDANLEWANKVLDALDAAGGSAAAVDGQMVDAPVVERARRILAAARG